MKSKNTQFPLFWVHISQVSFPGIWGLTREHGAQEVSRPSYSATMGQRLNAPLVYASVCVGSEHWGKEKEHCLAGGQWAQHCYKGREGTVGKRSSVSWPPGTGLHVQWILPPKQLFSPVPQHFMMNNEHLTRIQQTFLVFILHALLCCHNLLHILWTIGTASTLASQSSVSPPSKLPSPASDRVLSETQIWCSLPQLRPFSSYRMLRGCLAWRP